MDLTKYVTRNFIYMCVCMYMCVYMCVCGCGCIYIYTCVYICMCMYVFIYISSSYINFIHDGLFYHLFFVIFERLLFHHNT